MSQRTINDLQQAGISFAAYRDLARPIQDGQGAARWPLIAATDQILVAQRWKREALAAPQAGKVTRLPVRPGAPAAPTSDWFLAEDAAGSKSRAL